jgi:hypothetical protein
MRRGGGSLPFPFLPESKTVPKQGRFRLPAGEQRMEGLQKPRRASESGGWEA